MPAPRKKQSGADRIREAADNPQGIANTPRTQNTESTEEEHKENTERTRPDYDTFKESELSTFSVRLLPDDKQRLAEYFRRRGVPWGQGIRQVLLDYMEERGI